MEGLSQDEEKMDPDFLAPWDRQPPRLRPDFPEKKFPKDFDWDKIPRDKWKDPGFPGPPKVSPDAPQVGHHFDINPLQTADFRDRNQDGIEDRSQGIYDQPRDLIPWEFDKSRKWKRNIPPEILEKYKERLKDKEFATGGRIGKYGGGIGAAMPRIPTGMPRVNAGGISELDYRQEGGYVPMGVKEKADDVPAMLSKNEFVMTADAVKGAGGGNVEKGAQKMYDTMKRLEGRIA